MLISLDHLPLPARQVEVSLRSLTDLLGGKLEMTSLPLVHILVGAALLLFGRRLFWLFVAGVGFVVAARLATDSLRGQPQWVILIIALGVGVLGALASIFFQRVLVGIAGFFAGGYLLSALALGMNYQTYDWIGFLIGGVIGAILTMVLLDWALIFLSALTGATMIVQNVTLGRSESTLLFAVLLVVGIVVQVGQLGGKPRPQRKGDFE